VSSRHRAGLEYAEEVAGEVALEATDRLAHALALAGFALDVADGRSVVLAAADDDRVQRAVELSVAAGVESVAADAAGALRCTVPPSRIFNTSASRNTTG
jgi:hypothetical protein